MSQLQALHPRVLVLDLRMPDGPSVERIERLREQSPATEIVVITSHENQMFADQALSAGAVEFVLGIGALLGPRSREGTAGR